MDSLCISESFFSPILVRVKIICLLSSSPIWRNMNFLDSVVFITLEPLELESPMNSQISFALLSTPSLMEHSNIASFMVISYFCWNSFSKVYKALYRSLILHISSMIVAIINYSQKKAFFLDFPKIFSKGNLF